MRLAPPKHLVESKCQDPIVNYSWDDWQERRELRVVDKDLLARLSHISQRAVLALGTGSAEWIVYRFEQLCDTSAPWNLIETAWAMNIHLRYCVGPECWNQYSEQGWEGPVKNPIRKALAYLESAFYLLASEYQTDPPIIVGKITNLTTYVMPAPDPFLTWMDQVLSRFETYYARDPNDPLGDVVPRQAVDPAYDFNPADTEFLVNEFLANLDYRSNMFLNSPAEMLEVIEGDESFEGVPYTFDIEADRRRRRGRTP